MTEVSVETCFVNLRVLSFSLKFKLKLIIAVIGGARESTLNALIPDRDLWKENIEIINFCSPS